MKNKTANLVGSLIVVAIAFYATRNLLLSLILGIVSFIAFWYYRPETRYWRAFWYILIGLITTNNISLNLLAKTSNLNIDLKYDDNNVVSVILALLLIVLAILDYLERKRKVKPKSNGIPSISTNVAGDGNITINGISNSTITINPDDSEQVREFLKEFNDKLDKLPVDVLDKLKTKEELENNRGSKIEVDIGILLQLDNPQNRKVTLKVSVTNLDKEPRYYNSPYFKLSNKVEFVSGASKQDTFLLFPISEIPNPLKLEFGQKLVIDFDTPPQQLQFYEQLNNGEDYIQVFVPTTLGELYSSNKLIVSDFIRKYKEFINAKID